MDPCGSKSIDLSCIDILLILILQFIETIPMNTISKIKQKVLSELPFLVLLIAGIIFASQALFQDGFYRTIDDVSTVRITHMYWALQQIEGPNSFPVRWAGQLAHGYGYPLFLFYAPLTYYIGAFSMLLVGFSHIAATKAIYVLPLIFGPILFYWASRYKFNAAASLISTWFFTFFTYRGYNVYIRGGVGESWAIAFIPLIFIGVFMLERDLRSRLAKSIIALGIGLTIISHNLVGMQVLFLILLYGLFFHKKNFSYWISLLLGLGLAAFYLLPMIAYINEVQVMSTQPNKGKILIYLLPILDMLKITFPYDVESKFSAIYTFLIVSGIITSLYAYIKLKVTQRLFLKSVFWGSFSLLLIILLSSEFEFLWKLTLPVTKILQFPWRVLALLSFTIPIAIGYFLLVLNRRIIYILVTVLCVLLTIHTYDTFRPREYSFYYEYIAEESGPCATTTWEDEFLPLSVSECATSSAPSFISVSNSTDVETDLEKPNRLSALVNSSINNQKLRVNKYYFPGWGVRINSDVVSDIDIVEKQGTFEFSVPEGSHRIDIYYSKTSIMWLADIVSIISITIIAIWIIFDVKNHYPNNSKD